MSPRFTWPLKLWVAFTVLVLGVTGFWAARIVTGLTPAGQLGVVPESTMWGMHGCAVAILAGFATLAGALYQILGRRRALTALALAVLGYLGCGLAPKTTRILFDEHLYMQIAQSIAYSGRAEGANYARVEYGQYENYNPWTNKQPNGHPYLLSWAFRVAGVSEDVAHHCNRILVGLTAAGIYLALALVPWSLPVGAGVVAAVLFIFTPLVPWWGHTVAVEPAAAATTVLAFLAACIHARLRNRETAQGLPSSALLLAGATAFAAYFRPESLLAFPLVAAVLWSTDDRFIEDLAAWGGLVLSAALVAPNLLHLWAVRTEDWGARDGRRFAFDFIGKNLHSNGGYFYNSQWFPVVGTVLAVAGLGWLLDRFFGTRPILT
ncbi:MAG TPA: glycosyltransferase family 39 protein, partial [Opitutaceae bacterium]|nr:glycosyltransferase family 39 protein [Opitutaceae bacterium]